MTFRPLNGLLFSYAVIDMEQETTLAAGDRKEGPCGHNHIASLDLGQHLCQWPEAHCNKSARFRGKLQLPQWAYAETHDRDVPQCLTN